MATTPFSPSSQNSSAFSSKQSAPHPNPLGTVFEIPVSKPIWVGQGHTSLRVQRRGGSPVAAAEFPPIQYPLQTPIQLFFRNPHLTIGLSGVESPGYHQSHSP